jgi:DNA mismatch repair ATPase MutS
LHTDPKSSLSLQVLKHLSETLDCRLLFATHYHPLTAEFASNPRIKLAHMACQMLLDKPPTTLPLQGPVDRYTGVETPQKTEQPAENGTLAEADSDDLQKEGQLVFLYKLRPGPCPKSYGLQVATLAGIPRTVVRAAASAARVMEGKLEKAFNGASRRVLDLPCQEESAVKGKDSREKALSSGIGIQVERGSAEREVGWEEGSGGELRVARELLGWNKGRSLDSGSDVGKVEGRSLEHEDVVRLWHELRV